MLDVGNSTAQDVDEVVQLLDLVAGNDEVRLGQAKFVGPLTSLEISLSAAPLAIAPRPARGGAGLDRLPAPGAGRTFRHSDKIAFRLLPGD